MNVYLLFQDTSGATALGRFNGSFILVILLFEDILSKKYNGDILRKNCKKIIDIAEEIALDVQKFQSKTKILKKKAEGRYKQWGKLVVENVRGSKIAGIKKRGSKQPTVPLYAK